MKQILRYSTPSIEWQSSWYTDMGKGTLFGVKDNSCESYKLTVKKINLAEIEFNKERFDYPGSTRNYPAIVNVNGRYAYLIGGQNLLSCMRFDIVTNKWENIPDHKAPARYYHTCCYLAGKIYMFNGHNNSAVLNEIQALPFKEEIKEQN